MTKKPAVIFDFDGVLADSFEILYQMVSESFAELGEPLNRDQYRSFFLKNVKEAEKEALGGEARFYEFQKILESKKESYLRAQLFDFADELVRAAANKANLAIVSSTPSALIEQKLSSHNLKDYFPLILGANRDFSKQEKLNQVLMEFDPKKQNSFFVSDTVGDLKDGKSFSLRTIGVTWGFHDRDTLAKVESHAVIDHYRELLDLI